MKNGVLTSTQLSPGSLGLASQQPMQGAGLDAPAAAVVPQRDAAGGLGLRTAAAHRIQAVALGLLLGAELVDELAVLEMTATLAVVVDRLVEDQGGLVVRSQLGQLVHHDDVDQHGHQPLGVGRAAGDVDDRHVDADLLQILLDAQRAGGVGVGTHPAAVDRARTQRHDGVGVRGGLDQMLRAGHVGHAQRLASPALQHGTLVDEDVVAGLDRLRLGLLHGVAGGGGQGLGVVQGDHLQNHRGRIRRLHLGEGLRAARAGSTLDPDDRIQIAPRCTDHGFLERLRHTRSSELAQPGRDGDSAAEFHEAATRYATRLEHALKLSSHGFSSHAHTSSWCPRLVRFIIHITSTNLRGVHQKVPTSPPVARKCYEPVLW